MIRKTALRNKGGSGPSGMPIDADGRHRILASNNFGTSSSDLRKGFGNVVQILCTDLVETHAIEAFLSCRLIPLDKNPGLQPIVVGEVLRRIAGKLIVSVLKEDVIKCTGTLQVWVGQETCIEAAIHSMNMMYEDENTDAILLVDASNAFSSLNRQSFLHNISYLGLSVAIFVKNCYSTPSRLFIIGGTEITLREGATQGDSASMAIYGIGVTPLISMLIDILSNEYSANVMAYPDDSSAAGNLQVLKKWWSVLTKIGPKFGYYPEPTKTWVVVKPSVSEKTESVFFGTKIKIKTEDESLNESLKTNTPRQKLINGLVSWSYCQR